MPAGKHMMPHVGGGLPRPVPRRLDRCGSIDIAGKYFDRARQRRIVVITVTFVQGDVGLEQGQQEDGSVTIPEALRPYMGGQALLSPEQ